MIDSRIHTVRYENGEMQRYQVVSGFAWEDLCDVKAPFTPAVFEELCHLYRDFVVAKNPELYGALVMLHVPSGMEQPFAYDSRYGKVFDFRLASAMALRSMVQDGVISCCNRTLQVNDPVAARFLEELEKKGYLNVIYGERNVVNIMPFGDDLGFLSEKSPSFPFICNTSFFEMDLLDNDSPYDLFGTPYGLSLKDGVMSRPPINDREALLVDKAHNVGISYPTVRDMDIRIQGKVFRNNCNCSVYGRPSTRTTPVSDGLDIVVVGTSVVAFHHGGGINIPACGFVIHTTEVLEEVPSCVEYLGFEDMVFGIQVGSSSVKDGVIMTDFQSPFFDYRKDTVPYPPSMYPLNFAKDRAPRMAICSDSEGKPFIVWAEGCSKRGYNFGNESCGASLLELGQYCHSIGAYQCLNMDGGGSAEIFIDGKLKMHVSDRHEDNSDSERPVPAGLGIRL